MESYKNRFIICVIVCLLLSSMAYGFNSSDVDLLDDLFHSSANETLPKHQSGRLFNISLPSNYSGMQLSAIRLRSSTFWMRGANYNSINIPPRVVTTPYAKRIAILYENLGNWSSSYFRVRNYSMVTPIIGFSVFDASNSNNLGNEELALSLMGDDDLITVTFPDFVVQDKNVTPQCVTFGFRKTIQPTSLSGPNVCATKVAGRFAIIIPSPPPPPDDDVKETETEKKVIIFVSVFGGMAVLILVGVVIYKVVKKRKMKKMEGEADKGVALDTTWIGRSKMPSASMVRTQPTLEHEYVP